MKQNSDRKMRGNCDVGCETMPEIDDNSLLKCTWNKSVDVFTKVVLVVSIVILSIVGLAIIIKGLVVLWTYLWTDVYYWLEIIISTPISFLFSIPWYGYAGVMAALAIPVYSFLWCIAKRLTESDWSSEAANEAATFISISIVVVALAVIASALGTLHDSYPNPSLPGSVILSLAILSLGFTLFLSDSKLFLFCGAYSSYRKRIKNGEKHDK